MPSTKNSKGTDTITEVVKVKKSAKFSKTTKDPSVVTGKQESNVIYLGHIPDGFYETEMRNFFSQFGEIMKIKLFRSEKSNNSKGYAFIMFKSAEDAKVVAEAMNGYFLLEKQLISHVIPVHKHHSRMFSGTYGKNKKMVESTKKDEESTKPEKTIEERDLSHSIKLRSKQNKLKKLGIDFDIPILEVK